MQSQALENEHPYTQVQQLRAGSNVHVLRKLSTYASIFLPWTLGEHVDTPLQMEQTCGNHTNPWHLIHSNV